MKEGGGPGGGEGGKKTESFYILGYLLEVIKRLCDFKFFLI